MRTLQSAWPLLVLAVAALAGHATSNDSRARLVAELQLGSAQVALMQACETSFHEHRHDIAPSIGVMRGCGCFAKRISSTAAAADYRPAAAAIDALLGLRSAARGTREPRELTIAHERFAVDRAAALSQIGPSIAAMSHCTDPLNHMTEAERSEFERRIGDSSRG